jgi:hypothetical protein
MAWYQQLMTRLRAHHAALRLHEQEPKELNHHLLVVGLRHAHLS